MKPIFSFFLLFIFLFCPIPSEASATDLPTHPEPTPSSYVFRHISNHQGLPQNYIGSVFRLPDGRVGMRAADLIIWDGAKFTRFPEPDAPAYSMDNGPMNFNQYIDNDNRLWMKKRGELRLFDLNHSRYILNIDSIFRSRGFTKNVDGVNIDNEDTFWIVLEGIIWKSDAGKPPVKVKQLNPSTAFMEVARSSDGKWAWLLFSDGSLMKWDCSANTEVASYDILKDYVKLGDQGVVKPLKNNTIAIMTDNAVGIFDESSATWTPLLPYNTNPVEKFTSMEIDSKGRIWIGRPKRGFYVVNPVTGKVNFHNRIPLLSGNQITSDIQHIYADNESNGIWIALHDNGILYYNDRKPRSFYTDMGSLGNFRNDVTICSLLRLHDGSLIVGTGRGLYKMADKESCPQQIHDLTQGKICRVLFEDSRNRLWTGTFDTGLIMTQDGNSSPILFSSTDYHDNINYNNIRTITEDNDGRIWVGIYGGFGMLDDTTLEYICVPDNDNIFKEYGLISDMTVSPKGEITVACEKGTFYYSPHDGRVRRVTDNLTIPEGMDNPARLRCNSVTFDNDENLWLGTHTGVYVIKPDGKIGRFGIKEGLANPVHRILCDERGRIWVSTATSIYSAELTNESGKASAGIRLAEYLEDTSIPNNDLLSFQMVADGNDILAATHTGIIRLSPTADSLPGKRATDKLPIFNSLKIAGIDIGVGEKFHNRIIYDTTLGSTPSISLCHNENNITIGFVNLNFDDLSSANFRYRLDGFDQEWSDITFTGQQGQVTYNNLPPGHYRLRVTSVEHNGTISPEAVFSIHITAPWWQTWWFRGLAIILLIGLFIIVFLYVQRCHAQRLRDEAHKQELERKKELEEMKLSFFTNISHELRTPLTMIITPLQSIIDKMEPATPLHSKLTSIHQNARNLLMLINQLLDFRKLEVGAEKYSPAACNIADIIRGTALPFVENSAEKDIVFTLDLPPHRVVIDGDKPKLTRIFSNLFSNAVKYTPAGGKINVKLTTDPETETVRVDVTDTGIGIPDNEREKIFERFYRASNTSELQEANASSGLGLHLVKEYMRMHGGEISAQSNNGKGTVFRMTFPIQVSTSTDNVAAKDDTSEEEMDNSKPLLLLADDNLEFRAFLAGELSEYYRVIDVENGAQALVKARQMNPQIIVSDVMMPGMNGLQLTKEVKSDIATSHIPIVLLTAHANESDEASGYESGADAYISKPFNMHLLLTRIANLIEQQRGRWEKFEHHLDVNPAEISISSPDEELIGKALESVENHLDESGFSVDNLAEEIGVSKATLYRKLQAITGQTPVVFMRTIRLKRAAHLLRTTKNPISDIAYRTGFTSPRYFSRLFKEEFGTLPTDYRASAQNIPET